MKLVPDLPEDNPTSMHGYAFVVVVDAVTPKQADRVMAERLDHEEDLGFDYRISWEEYRLRGSWVRR